MAADQTGTISGTDYRRIAGHWLTGVTVVTALTGQDRPTGVTMNAIAPLSLDPPQFLINLDLGSETLAAISVSRRFCINFLRADQGAVSGCFARRGAEKFEGIAHARGKLDMPVIEGCIAHVECAVSAIHYSGDHAIVIGDAVSGAAMGGDPLVYYTSSLRELAPCM
jgi:flavin reductase (DIM6/NTAB) family NADH-FMN oxidoreductase RutF